MVEQFQTLLGSRSGRKRECKDARINDRLAAGLGSNRPHRMRRVPEKRDAPEAPARERLAVVLGKFIDFIGIAD